MKQKIIYWTPVLVWMGIIFLFSTKQRVSVSQVELYNFIFFKSLHVIEYAFLYLLVFRAQKYTRRNTSEKSWFRFAFLITILYAMTDELHQTFVPTREGTVRDVIIDSIGGALSWISIQHIQRIMPKTLKHWVEKWQII